jgi:hypothetical protein
MHFVAYRFVFEESISVVPTELKDVRGCFKPRVENPWLQNGSSLRLYVDEKCWDVGFYFGGRNKHKNDELNYSFKWLMKILLYKK